MTDTNWWHCSMYLRSDKVSADSRVCAEGFPAKSTVYSHGAVGNLRRDDEPNNCRLSQRVRTRKTIWPCNRMERVRWCARSYAWKHRICLHVTSAVYTCSRLQNWPYELSNERTKMKKEHIRNVSYIVFYYQHGITQR